MPVDLDLNLALRRLETDYQYGRAFVQHPFEHSIVSLNRDAWLTIIGERLTTDTYHPSAAQHTNIPKGSGGVRPGALLCLDDQVVYTALVGAALREILATLHWSQPPKDLAYQFRKAEKVEWISAPFWCWQQFRKRSIELLDAGAVVTVSTDITGFYEHIDHEILISDLRACGVSEAVCTLLGTCLGRWCCLNGRGLPQNMTASHILAKLYLCRVDHAMADQGFEHVRYVDDIRIFCRSNAEAKRALLALAVVLRDRGLTLQTAKTEILLPVEARSRFDGIMPVLSPLIEHFVEGIARQAGIDAAYLSVTEAEELVAKGVAEVPTEMLRAAYDAHFVKTSGHFDKTMFHFLIARLGKARDGFAVEHCIGLLESHPEETDHVLSYVSKVGATATAEDRILVYFRGDGAIYDYQIYQLFRWRTGQPDVPSEGLLSFARGVAAGANTAPHVLSAARAFLGRFGTAADLDELMRRYGEAKSDVERAEIVCSISRVEKGRRNAMLGKLKNDGFLTCGAAKAVRSNVDWYAA